MPRLLALAPFLVLVLGGADLRAQGEVTAYVSLDQEFSSEILDLFEKSTGIKVNRAFDAEQDKTVGMVNRIISEREHPRGDVFWNNEVAQTIRLKNMRLLQAYRSPMAEAIPASFKDPEGYWTGLAARARVFIFNRSLLGTSEAPRHLSDLTDPRWKGRLAMARPLTGTTLTHLAALYSIWGVEKTRRFVDSLFANDVNWQAGNAMVMREVGQGAFVWGLTDTDDANVSITVKGHPTGVVLPDQGDGEPGTLLIPNSVAILAGAKNLENARRLVDFILSPEVETRLAAGRSAQIPLRPGLAPPAAYKDVKPMEVDWEKVGRMIEEHQGWLKQRFTVGASHAGEKTSTVAWVLGIAAFAVIAVLVGRRSAIR